MWRQRASARRGVVSPYLGVIIRDAYHCFCILRKVKILEKIDREALEMSQVSGGGTKNSGAANSTNVNVSVTVPAAPAAPAGNGGGTTD